MHLESQALSVADFCHAYSICRTLAYEEIKAGRLLVRKLGRRTLIRKTDADAWLNSLPESRQQGPVDDAGVNEMPAGVQNSTSAPRRRETSTHLPPN